MELDNYDEFPQVLPILIEKEIFLYPFMITPLFIEDNENIEAVDYAVNNNKLLFVACAKDDIQESRKANGFYDVGVVGNVMRKINLGEGKVKILFQGLGKGRITDFKDEDALFGKVNLIPEKQIEEEEKKEIKSAVEVLLGCVKKLLEVNPKFPNDLFAALKDNDNPVRVADLISSVIKMSKEEAYELFSEIDIKERLLKIIELINNEIEIYKIQKDISQKVTSKLEKTHKDFFLKEQIKEIQKQLGDDNQKDEEIVEYREKLEKLKDFIPKEGYIETKKQIDKLERLNPESPDASLLQTYVETVLEIPFGEYSTDEFSAKEVEEQLNKDHYSLKKPKERITEFFAVRQLLEQRKIEDSEAKGTVLCFVGPPGVGKTSLANSIAKALKRKLVRIALGGLEDVNELRGHRRTYVGAMPGRLVSGLISANTMNPVVVLDEIDKVGANHRGDPTAVMLEVLDPEQNNAFRDLYLNFSIDLSQIVFISTANELGSIPAPLRDRMEFIEISSYTPNEKFYIAKDYLIPQELKRHGLKKSEVSLGKGVLEIIIDKYTREPGVRNLRRVFAKIFRKVAKKILIKPEIKKVSISKTKIEEYLEQPIFEIDPADKKNHIGITNGLAWTQVGGDLLKIEAIKLKGKENLVLTGNLGDVMKESAKISYSVVKFLIDEGVLLVDEEEIPRTLEEEKDHTHLDTSEMYKRYQIHLHVPEGATPKDGPSAGITMAISIASVLCNKPIKADLAMTGELTLSGKVLPIGGLKEKLIAAHRAKMKTVLIPRKNFERDLNDIPQEVKEDVAIKPVDVIEDVLKEALVF